ncbi:PEP-CTERM sorting domain-containing protein [Roseiarcus sp.]|uniref:PEP-CTERM sorting domain-containing protein n=1 Tax=Roseiarcus sp. TaxID=1969460 RepID=UPI003F9DBB05
MSKTIVTRAGVLCAALAGSAVLVGPASAQLINAGLGSVGPGGSPVTTVGGSSALSAALGWYQFTVVPGGTLTTTLETTTDPMGAGNMLHVVTDSGDWPPAEQGNGFGQEFVGDKVYADATLTYDIQVLSGQVTGGLALDVGYGIGVFTSSTPVTDATTGGWVQVTDHFTGADLASGVYFETETLGTGATYNVDNIAFTGTAVPEPTTMTLLAAGLGGMVMRRRKAKTARAIEA